MTEKIQGSIDAASFSRVQDWKKCPRFAYYKHVLKLKEPGNQAMERGSAIGKMAEQFILGTLKKCPAELKEFEVEFKELRKRKAPCEAQWAFDKDWKPVEWFAKEAWLRVKTDVYSFSPETKTLLVVDNKTGKYYPYHDEQLDLYALGGFLKEPRAEYVDARLWYLDGGKELPEEPKIYSRAEVPALKTWWLKETKPMFADRRFACKPSAACRYCFFSKAKNGPCGF